MGHSFSWLIAIFMTGATCRDDRQNFNFSFRLRQLRNNRGNFVEYLVPAL